MIKSKKKLALTVETVGTLTNDTLQKVAGGARSLCTYEQSGCMNGTKTDNKVRE